VFVQESEEVTEPITQPSHACSEFQNDILAFFSVL